MHHRFELTAGGIRRHFWSRTRAERAAKRAARATSAPVELVDELGRTVWARLDVGAQGAAL